MYDVLREGGHRLGISQLFSSKSVCAWAFSFFTYSDDMRQCKSANI